MMALFCATLFVGCSDTEPAPEPKIEYESSKEIEIQPDTKKSTVEFTVNTNWSVSLSDTKSDDDWIEVEPMSGPAGDVTLNIDMEPNTLVEDRIKYLKISAGDDEEIVITIKQDGVEPILTLDKSAESVEVGAGNLVLKLESNTSWSASTLPEWINLSAEDGEGSTDITLNYKENTSIDERTEVITFTAANKSTSFTLTQEGATPILSIDKSSETVGASASSLVLKLDSNTSWSVSTLPDWITLSAEDGKGNADITLNYEENPTVSERRETLTFTIAGKTVDFTIIQEGAVASISIDPLTIEVGAAKDTFTLSVTANGTWNVGALPKWVTLSATTGEAGTIGIFVTCEGNVGAKRDATITFTMQGAQVSLTLTQKMGQIGDLIIEDLN